MMTTLRLNVPRLFVVCLDCKRQVEVPSHNSRLPVEVTVPCECAAKPIDRFALHLMYGSEPEPAAILPLQEGRPGVRA